MSKPLPQRLLISNIIPESDSKHCLLLLLFGTIMLLIRVVPIHSIIFTIWHGEYGNYVNFSADDAIYHMRFVHNTLHHFPWRVFFDPFTYFPFGSHIAFGPLFTVIIATVALIVGFGHPSPELVNHVSAYVPPIMGMLCLIPVYFIARQLFGKKIAILSAFIFTFLPGEFLGRSALGFVDHHVAEVLFSTTTCALLIYTLNTAKSLRLTRTTLIYGLLSGITFGLFILIWQGALMFGAIFLIYFVTQLLIDHIKNNNTNYLLSLVSSTYIPPMVIVLPYTAIVPFTLYPSNNIPILAAMFLIFVACYLLHVALKRNQSTRNLYPLILIALFVLIILVINKAFPQIYALMRDGYKLLFHPTPGMATISEVHPTILGYDNKITAQLFWNNLFWTMPLTIIGIGCLGYSIYKNQRSTEIFLLVWTLVIVAASCAQLRFNYYLVINVSILSGLSIYSIFNLIKYLKSKKNLVIKLQNIFFLAFFFFFAFLIIDPILILLIDHKIPSGYHITQEWYNTLIWIKNHTPNPQGKLINKDFDYTSGYYPIPKDLKSHYDYPQSAYGIMTWWDQGHQITYIAERIPNATPFQQGVIGKDGTTGAAVFFTSTNEEQAVKNLDEIGSRYIITAKDIASTKFHGIAIWSNDTKGWNEIKNIEVKLPKKTLTFKAPIDAPKFLQSMIGQLFYNDANGLQHFRLIYENEGGYYVQIRQARLSKKPNVVNLGFAELLFKDYNMALEATKKINQVLINNGNNLFMYFARPPVKSVKVFEKVKGATISGEVPSNIPDNTQVKLTLNLKTKYDRTLIYGQMTKVTNGKYNFVVPYPTTNMSGDDYTYDIEPIGNYQIQINDQTIEVFVPENSVVLGETINAANFQSIKGTKNI